MRSIRDAWPEIHYLNVGLWSGKDASDSTYQSSGFNEYQLIKPEPQLTDIFHTYRLVRNRYLWWQINGNTNFEDSPHIPDFGQTVSSEYRSCTEADSAARGYILEGETANAVREVEYLRSRGYAEPGFIRFCEQHDLCGS